MSISTIQVQLAGRVVDLTAKNRQLLCDVSRLFPPAGDRSQERSSLTDPLRPPATMSGFERDSQAGVCIDLDELAALEQIELTPREAPFLVAPLITKVLHQIEGHIWIDATALLTDDGRLCLLAGGSGTGKTTLTLALALKHGCRIVCEDITLIDSQRQTVVPLAVPLHLRPGSEVLIQKVVQFDEGSFSRLGGWAYRSDLYWIHELDAKFHKAACLLPSSDDAFGKIKVKPVNSSEFLRTLLPIANVLRIPRGPEILSKVLPGSGCMTIEGGSLEERLEAYTSSG